MYEDHTVGLAEKKKEKEMEEQDALTSKRNKGHHERCSPHIRVGKISNDF